jgi:hypothetical protein
MRKLDNEWTFGKLNIKTGYLEIASVRIHRIVAFAFLGEPPTQEHVVDHIDTNRQNNRPNNLRWVTRLENAVLNEVTRKRIEYQTGVSIFEFLDNPSKYRDAFDTPDLGWMRQVTEAEGKTCLDNVRKWSQTTSGSPKSGNKLGEWIYQRNEQDQRITDSLTPMAKQLDWRTPEEFVCCPDRVVGDPLNCYFERLSVDAVFAKNQYGESKIVKCELVDHQAIVVMTSVPSCLKPLAVAKITFENGYYIHASLGTFFSDEGAEKHFVLAQGLEWTDGDTIDDFC